MFGGGGYGSSFGGAGAGGFGTPGATGGSSLFGGGGAGGMNPAGGYGAAGQGGAFGGGGFGAPAGGGGFGASAGAGGFGGGGFGAGGAGAGGFGSQGGGAFGSAPAGGGAFGRAPANSPGLGMGAGGFGTPGAGAGFGGAGGLGGGGFGTTNPQFGATGGAGFGAGGAGGGAFGGGASASSSMWGQQSRPGGGGGLFGSPQPTVAGGGGGFGMGGGGGAYGAQQQQPGFGAAGGGGGARGAEMHNPGGEVEIRPEERPSDTVTSVRFTPSMDPNQQLVTVSSWDQSVRVFQLFGSGVQAKAMANATAPVFDTCFRSDGAAIFAGCADGTVQMWSLGSGGNQMQAIGRHDAACSSINWIPEYSLCVTSSWDKTIKYWDARSPQPAQVVDCKERIHTMAVKSHILVVACAGPNFPLYVFDLKNPQMPIRERVLKPGTTSHPKMAVRSVAISTDAQFFCCAGIEGRVNIIYIDDNQQSKNFTFRCHKTEETRGSQTLKYHNPVNNLSFHPRTNVLATCGSDGSYCYWDIAERARLHQGPQSRAMTTQSSQHKKCMFPGGDRPAPIVAAGFNAEGSIYAYATGYDWNLGPQWNLPQNQVNALVFHSVKPDELKKKGR